MYFTSYYGKMKKFPANFIPVSISRQTPVWFQGIICKELAPTWDILNEYKNNPNQEEAEQRYNERFQNEILSKTSPEQIQKLLKQSIKNNISIDQDDIHFIFLCFEKEGDFCHRNLVAKWFGEHNIFCRELIDIDFDYYGKQSCKNKPLPIDTVGKEILKYQENLAEQYKYRNVPKKRIDEVYDVYIEALPTFLDIDTLKTIELDKTYCYELKGKDIPIYSRNGTLIAEKYDRIVLGNYGAFIEIDKNDIILSNLKIKEGQEYRIQDPKYSEHVKYHWYTTKDESDCKLYFQQKRVTYADYKPGKWYISPYEILNQREIELYIQKDHRKITLDLEEEEDRDYSE